MTAKWEEKEVFTNENEHIDEWQSQRCSHCKLYLTTPYSYYWTSYRYCPNCGAKMEGEEDGKIH